MQELNREQKLIAYAIEGKRLADERGETSKGCAFTYAEDGSGIPYERLGFVDAEIKGIMDGWDKADGKSGFFYREQHQPGYSYGFELGQKIYKVLYGK